MFSFFISNTYIFANTKHENNPIWKIILFVIAVTVVAYSLRVILFGFLVSGPDLQTFLDGAKYFAGEGSVIGGDKILKPFPVLVVALIHIISGMDILNSFNFFVFGSYVAMALAAAFLFYIFFEQNKLQTLTGTFIVIFSYPILKYGIDPNSETIALAFVYFSTALTLIYNRTEKIRYLLLALFFILFGFLWKEYSAVVGILLFFIVVHKFYLNYMSGIIRYKEILIVTFIPLVFLVSWNVFTYYVFNFTYIDWIGMNQKVGFTQFTFYYLAKSIFGTLMFSWFLVLVALLKYNLIKPQQRSEIILISMVSPIVFAWGYVSSRLFFPVTIPFIILAVFGYSFICNRFGRKAYILLMIIYIVTCFAWVFTSGNMKDILGN
jgi:hypothetical protein